MTTWREYKNEETEIKMEVMERIRKARADGVPAGIIAKESSEGMSIHVIYDMLEAKILPLDKWKQVDEGLKRLGY